MPGENTEAITRHFEEANAIFAAGGDQAALTDLAERDVDPECVAELGVMEGTFTGREGFVRYFVGQLAVIDDMRIEPLEILEFGDRVVMPFRLHGTARETGLPVEFRYTQLFTLRDGRFIHSRMYADKERALAALGEAAPESEQSIQRKFFPAATCFGCGPENPGGLRISSFPAPAGHGVVCDWQPEPHHAAGSGVLNGGIIGTLLDCHSAAAVVYEAALREPEKRDHWLTAEYTVKLRRPTNPDLPVELFAEVVEWDGDRATTHAELRSEGEVRATCTARFVRHVPRDDAAERPLYGSSSPA